MKERNEINAKFLPFIKALQEKTFWNARTLIAKEGIDLNQIIDEDSGDTYLHWAVRKGDRNIITFLLNKSANVNSMNKNNETPIQSALNLVIKAFHQGSREHNQAIDTYKPLVLLLKKYGGIIPKNFKLRPLFVKLPDVNILEIYNQSSAKFLPFEPLDENRIQKAKKDAVIFFFGKYDFTPEHPNFGAIHMDYDANYSPTQTHYPQLAKNFLVFRVLITNVQQIEEHTKTIRQLLPANQHIKHLVITSHANDSFMLFDIENGKYSLLRSEDDKNDFAMTKTFALLSKDASIALAGCSTSKGMNNITEKLSTIAEGRVVFGSTNTMSFFQYLNFYNKFPKPNRIPLLFFNNKKDNFVTAYKDGEVIADCMWQAKL